MNKIKIVNVILLIGVIIGFFWFYNNIFPLIGKDIVNKNNTIPKSSFEKKALNLTEKLEVDTPKNYDKLEKRKSFTIAWNTGEETYIVQLGENKTFWSITIISKEPFGLKSGVKSNPESVLSEFLNTDINTGFNCTDLYGEYPYCKGSWMSENGKYKINIFDDLEGRKLAYKQINSKMETWGEINYCFISNQVKNFEESDCKYD